MRLPSLTGLRFAAALAVFGVHYPLFLGGDPRRFADEVFGLGWLGVTFFFVLSGFVLTWSRRPDDTARRSWRRRFARVYPPHLAAWVVTFGVLVATGRPTQLRAALPSLVLVQAWLADKPVVLGWNPVAWTLSVEVFFYAVFPFAFLLVNRVPRPLRLLPLLALPSLGLGVYLEATHPQDAFPTVYWLYACFPPARLGEFLVGVVLALALRRGQVPRVPLWLAGASVAVVAVALTVTGRAGGLGNAAMLGPIGLVLVAAAQRDVVGRPTFWSRPTLVWLGERSFAFYLLHVPILLAWAHLAGVTALTSWFAALAWAPVTFAACLGAAALLHRYVEVPAERRLRGEPPNAAATTYAALPEVTGGPEPREDGASAPQRS